MKIRLENSQVRRYTEEELDFCTMWQHRLRGRIIYIVKTIAVHRRLGKYPRARYK